MWVRICIVQHPQAAAHLVAAGFNRPHSLITLITLITPPDPDPVQATTPRSHWKTPNTAHRSTIFYRLQRAEHLQYASESFVGDVRA